jgi:hypothetical protein
MILISLWLSISYFVISWLAPFPCISEIYPIFMTKLGDSSAGGKYWKALNVNEALWTGRAAPHSLLLRKVAKTKVEKYQKIG